MFQKLKQFIAGSGLGWTDEEEALISEFTAILSTTPKDRIIETTRFLMLSGDDDIVDSDIKQATDHLLDQTTFSQQSELIETPRSLLSTTSRASNVNRNSILFDSTSQKPSTFADLLPKESLNPPKLEQATTFEDLLRPPNIYEETEQGRTKIDLEKKRLMIKEALERIRSSKDNTKLRFQPKPPHDVRKEKSFPQNTKEVISENKFEDYYEDQSTWGPVTNPDEYCCYEENEGDHFKKMMEEHTESNFGMDILNVPNMMESTLLKLLTKTNKNIETLNLGSTELPLREDEERLAKLQVVTVNKKDPLNKDLREFAVNDDYTGNAPRPHQNPFLSILNPSKQDYSDNIFSVPEYKQDPFLRMLRKNPKNYQDDFLSLPQKEQNQLLKVLMKAGKDFDIDQLLPPDYKQNPLLRLLVPHYQDNIENISPPDITNNMILNAMMQDPGKFANDFLILSDNDKKEVLNMVDEMDDGTFKMELLIPSKSERLRILSNHSNKDDPENKHSKRKNPLLDILEGDKRDEFDKQHLSVPLYKQDPLMRQLRIHPEQFKDDFLELPSRKQDTLLKILKKSGIPSWNIDRLTPPDFVQNPLIRLLDEGSSRDSTIMKDLLVDPSSFKNDFSDLSFSQKLEVMEMIEHEEEVEAVLEELVPNKSERLKIMTKNPLLRFLEANKEDEYDKHNLTPPKYRQDPLLRQLRLQPEIYHNDFLELPRRKQDTLLKVLKKSGLETRLMERLIPPGNRQDPLLRALIGNHNEEISNLKAPKNKQNPLLKMLEGDKRDKFDKGHLTLPEKEEIFRTLVESPETLSNDFKELTEQKQSKVLEMIEKSGRESEVMEKLKSNRKDPLLKALKEKNNEDIVGIKAPQYKQNPLLRILQPDKKDKFDRDHLSLPEKEHIFRNLVENSESFKEDFQELSEENQAQIIGMIQKSGKGSEQILETLVSGKFEKLKIVKDPLITKNIPKYTQSDAFRELKDNKLPNKKLNSDMEDTNLLQKVINNPEQYEEAFDKLPKHDQESLMKIIETETGSELENDFLEALGGSTTDMEGTNTQITVTHSFTKTLNSLAQRLLSFYQWSKELMTRLNKELWDQIKSVVGQVIREQLGIPI